MSVMTRLVSPGPVFFRQERVGHQGHRFKILKFRTMRLGSDDTVHRNHFAQLVQKPGPDGKARRARRLPVDPGGWVLRATGLDELPQLINILCGDMSLVGAASVHAVRVCAVSAATARTFQRHPRHDRSLAGVGKNRTTFDEMVRLDIRYARRLSLLRDLAIIVRTPWAVAVQFLDTSRRRNSATGPAVAVPSTTPFEESARPAA